MASDAGWTTIGGIEAMIEQGLAQQRLWLLQSEVTSPFNGQRHQLGREVEENVSELIRGLGDITVPIAPAPRSPAP